jgi:hypothetical protein
METYIEGEINDEEMMEGKRELRRRIMSIIAKRGEFAE